ncbi:hypothetical protein [Stakelama tenebrarum]|uniref:Uncharacterized protein n=1 Tax=Stakelama tenebrarum TaxID=2711215 RepID=A0A6G6Y3Z2_9SPHN|nr:hypothetical protein [Sphingosinithalassobacter tenebrarum]QIG79664.1 hypothetical protein G5C33_07575 [Sphingosinithalassobacter tenebrarum]
MKALNTALRIQQRELDALRVSITVEIERVDGLSDAQRAHLESERRERAAAAAATEIWMPTDAWAARARAERARLARNAQEAGDRLTALRVRAAESYGTMRAIEEAVNRRREEIDREHAAVEQAQADDFGTARFLAARGRERRGMQ